VLGGLGTEAFQLLIITSLFAAILTFHNNVARYLFSLAAKGCCGRDWDIRTRSAGRR